MPKVDDELNRRLRSASQQIRTDHVLAGIDQKRRRGEIRRRIGAVGLAVVVIGATVGGFLVLQRAFRGDDEFVAEPPAIQNGPLVVVVGDPADRGSHLELVPIDGSPTVWLTPPGDGINGSPSASPDGRSVAYLHDPAGNGGPVTLRVLNLATRESRDVFEGVIYGPPAWSPDGSRLAVTGYGDHDRILVVPADGSGVAEPVPGSGVVGGEPDWSPDGSKLVFEERDVPGGPAVVTVDVGTGELTKLVGTDGDTAAEPDWSPDGTTILFASTGGLWTIDAKGGKPSLLIGYTADDWAAANHPPSPHQPEWSPDGTTFAAVLSGAHRQRIALYSALGAGPEILSEGSAVTWLIRDETLPTLGPLPSPSPSMSGEAETIPGVPFPVCRPMSIPGDFGAGLDTLWVFEKQNANGEGCIAEGFQYLGIGTADRVILLSDEIHDIGQNETELWPCATPDIDSDGIDEIALGIDGSRKAGYAYLTFFGIVDGNVRQLPFDCGPACSPIAWAVVQLDVSAGVDCAAPYDESGGPMGLVTWSASASSTAPASITWNHWSLIGGRLTKAASGSYDAHDAPSLPEDLCGSPSFWPDDFPNYPKQP